MLSEKSATLLSDIKTSVSQLITVCGTHLLKTIFLLTGTTNANCSLKKHTVLTFYQYRMKKTYSTFFVKYFLIY